MQFHLDTLFRSTILFGIAFALILLVTYIDDPMQRVLPIAMAISVLGAGFGTFFSRGLVMFFIAGVLGFIGAIYWAGLQYVDV